MTFEKFASELKEVQKLYAEYLHQREQGPSPVEPWQEKYSIRFYEAKKAYFDGAGKDPVEQKIRRDILSGLFWHMQSFTFSESELEERLEAARGYLKTIDRKKVKRKLKLEKDKKDMLGPVVMEPRSRSLTITERMISFIFGQERLERNNITCSTRGGELTHKVMWAVDFLSKEISNTFKNFSNGEKDIVLFENVSEFEALQVQFDKPEMRSLRGDCLSVSFNASDVRDMLGFTSNEMSIKDVKELFQRLQEVIFDLKRAPVFCDSEHGGFSRVSTTIGQNLYTLKIDKLDIAEAEKKYFSNRWKTRDLKITCIFDTIMGWLFVGNLSCGKYGWLTLPKGYAKELNKGEQNVLRELRLHGGGRRYSVRDMAGLIETEAEELAGIKRAVDIVLGGLVEKKYMKKPKIEGRGWKTTYQLI